MKTKRSICDIAEMDDSGSLRTGDDIFLDLDIRSLLRHILGKEVRLSLAGYKGGGIHVKAVISVIERDG